MPWPKMQLNKHALLPDASEGLEGPPSAPSVLVSVGLLTIVRGRTVGAAEPALLHAAPAAAVSTCGGGGR